MMVHKVDINQGNQRKKTKLFLSSAKKFFYKFYQNLQRRQSSFENGLGEISDRACIPDGGFWIGQYSQHQVDGQNEVDGTAQSSSFHSSALSNRFDVHRKDFVFGGLRHCFLDIQMQTRWIC